LAVVVTITANVVVLPAVSLTGLATVHEVVAGAPEHAMVTVPENAEPGVNWMLYCAVCPAVTVAVKAEAALVTAKAEALTVPFTVTVCGELLALSVMVMVSVFGVELIGLSGAKLTGMEHVALAAIGAVQADAGFTNSDIFVPLNVTLVTTKGALPVFVTTTFIGLLVVPCVALNDKVVGATVAAPPFPLVPLSATSCGLVAALSSICNPAWNNPTPFGVKAIDTEQVFGVAGAT
jgi:hypothetical protein